MSDSEGEINEGVKATVIAAAPPQPDSAENKSNSGVSKGSKARSEGEISENTLANDFGADFILSNSKSEQNSEPSVLSDNVSTTPSVAPSAGPSVFLGRLRPEEAGLDNLTDVDTKSAITANSISTQVMDPKTLRSSNRTIKTLRTSSVGASDATLRISRGISSSSLPGLSDSTPEGGNDFNLPPVPDSAPPTALDTQWLGYDPNIDLDAISGPRRDGSRTKLGVDEVSNSPNFVKSVAPAGLRSTYTPAPIDVPDVPGIEGSAVAGENLTSSAGNNTTSPNGNGPISPISYRSRSKPEWYSFATSELSAVISPSSTVSPTSPIGRAFGERRVRRRSSLYGAMGFGFPPEDLARVYSPPATRAQKCLYLSIALGLVFALSVTSVYLTFFADPGTLSNLPVLITSAPTSTSALSTPTFHPTCFSSSPDLNSPHILTSPLDTLIRLASLSGPFSATTTEIPIPSLGSSAGHIHSCWFADESPLLFLSSSNITAYASTDDLIANTVLSQAALPFSPTSSAAFSPSLLYSAPTSAIFLQPSPTTLQRLYFSTNTSTISSEPSDSVISLPDPSQTNTVLLLIDNELVVASQATGSTSIRIRIFDLETDLSEPLIDKPISLSSPSSPDLLLIGGFSGISPSSFYLYTSSPLFELIQLSVIDTPTNLLSPRSLSSPSSLRFPEFALTRPLIGSPAQVAGLVDGSAFFVAQSSSSSASSLQQLLQVSLSPSFEFVHLSSFSAPVSVADPISLPTPLSPIGIASAGSDPVVALPTQLEVYELEPPSFWFGFLSLIALEYVVLTIFLVALWTSRKHVNRLYEPRPWASASFGVWNLLAILGLALEGLQVLAFSFGPNIPWAAPILPQTLAYTLQPIPASILTMEVRLFINFILLLLGLYFSITTILLVREDKIASKNLRDLFSKYWAPLRWIISPVFYLPSLILGPAFFPVFGLLLASFDCRLNPLSGVSYLEVAPSVICYEFSSFFDELSSSNDILFTASSTHFLLFVSALVCVLLFYPATVRIAASSHLTQKSDLIFTDQWMYFVALLKFLLVVVHTFFTRFSVPFLIFLLLVDLTYVSLLMYFKPCGIGRVNAALTAWYAFAAVSAVCAIITVLLDDATDATPVVLLITGAVTISIVFGFVNFYDFSRGRETKLAAIVRQKSIKVLTGVDTDIDSLTASAFQNVRSILIYYEDQVCALKVGPATTLTELRAMILDEPIADALPPSWRFLFKDCPISLNQESTIISIRLGDSLYLTPSSFIPNLRQHFFSYHFTPLGVTEYKRKVGLYVLLALSLALLFYFAPSAEVKAGAFVPITEPRTLFSSNFTFQANEDLSCVLLNGGDLTSDSSTTLFAATSFGRLLAFDWSASNYQAGALFSTIEEVDISFSSACTRAASSLWFLASPTVGDSAQLIQVNTTVSSSEPLTIISNTTLPCSGLSSLDSTSAGASVLNYETGASFLLASHGTCIFKVDITSSPSSPTIIGSRSLFPSPEFETGLAPLSLLQDTSNDTIIVSGLVPISALAEDATAESSRLGGATLLSLDNDLTVIAATLFPRALQANGAMELSAGQHVSQVNEKVYFLGRSPADGGVDPEFGEVVPTYFVSEFQARPLLPEEDPGVAPGLPRALDPTRLRSDSSTLPSLAFVFTNLPQSIVYAAQEDGLLLSYAATGEEATSLHANYINEDSGREVGSVSSAYLFDEALSQLVVISIEGEDAEYYSSPFQLVGTGGGLAGGDDDDDDEDNDSSRRLSTMRQDDDDDDDEEGEGTGGSLSSTVLRLGSSALFALILLFTFARYHRPSAWVRPSHGPLKLPSLITPDSGAGLFAEQEAVNDVNNDNTTTGDDDVDNGGGIDIEEADPDSPAPASPTGRTAAEAAAAAREAASTPVRKTKKKKKKKNNNSGDLDELPLDLLVGGKKSSLHNPNNFNFFSFNSLIIILTTAVELFQLLALTSLPSMPYISTTDLIASPLASTVLPIHAGFAQISSLVLLVLIATLWMFISTIAVWWISSSDDVLRRLPKWKNAIYNNFQFWHPLICHLGYLFITFTLVSAFQCSPRADGKLLLNAERSVECWPAGFEVDRLFEAIASLPNIPSSAHSEIATLAMLTLFIYIFTTLSSSLLWARTFARQGSVFYKPREYYSFSMTKLLLLSAGFVLPDFPQLYLLLLALLCGKSLITRDGLYSSNYILNRWTALELSLLLVTSVFKLLDSLVVGFFGTSGTAVFVFLVVFLVFGFVWSIIEYKFALARGYGFQLGSRLERQRLEQSIQDSKTLSVNFEFSPSLFFRSLHAPLWVYARSSASKSSQTTIPVGVIEVHFKDTLQDTRRKIESLEFNPGYYLFLTATGLPVPERDESKYLVAAIGSRLEIELFGERESSVLSALRLSTRSKRKRRRATSNQNPSVDQPGSAAELSGRGAGGREKNRMSLNPSGAVAQLLQRNRKESEPSWL